MYLKGLKTKNRYALTFGSYGWSKIGFKEFEDSVKDAGFELIEEGKYVQFVPEAADLESLKQYVSFIKEKIEV